MARTAQRRTMAMHIRFRLCFSGSGEAGGVAYSASMTIDEDAAQTLLGAFSMSSNGLSPMPTMQMTLVAWKQPMVMVLMKQRVTGNSSYAANGFSAGYEVDEHVKAVFDSFAGYAANGLSIGLEVQDDDWQRPASDNHVNTVSVGYTMGAMSVHMMQMTKLLKIMTPK